MISFGEVWVRDGLSFLSRIGDLRFGGRGGVGEVWRDCLDLVFFFVYLGIFTCGTIVG